MANISPTIQIYNFTTPCIIENILLGSTCSTMKLIEYKAPFQEFRYVYVWLYAEMLGLYATIIENHIGTWNDASLV